MHNLEVAFILIGRRTAEIFVWPCLFRVGVLFANSIIIESLINSEVGRN